MNIKSIARRIFKTEEKKEDTINGEFGQRIRARHARFWKTEDGEQVRNTIHFAEDPIEIWKDKQLWQRKLSNKFNAREFAKKHGCQVAELYWRGRDLNTLDFAQLPAQYVMRPTIGHNSNQVFLMNDGVNILENKPYTPEEIKAALQKAFDANPSLEFVVEEFLQNEAGEYKIPVDYKMYLFNGELAAFLVIQRSGPTKGFGNFYDEKWTPIERLRTHYPEGELLPKPHCFDQMVADAKRLSKAYEIFVRIDFYATPQGAVFGEFTPTPALGKDYTEAGEQLLLSYWNRFTPGKF
ncbi:TupA-like ATPgrasp [Cnuella takakiae]|uniref:TupA-like ATPgrasp n=1 Tax=Cnuella takakiae TaxID=1302690 RepID=A0A1M4V6N9_9BACT|nr:ATP-grasp fold amidoligase family protein [Cnuella takakiae]OLY92692.1 hypothetical protein BUE76_12950 [Cnuella takakiae]SHE64533.1 TupA-like ATPgrasp [Cnuella takakiae]